MESLSNGVPLVAISITDDQPGVAARIAWTGTGEFVSLSHLSVPRLWKAIQQVLSSRNLSYRAITLTQKLVDRIGVKSIHNH